MKITSVEFILSVANLLQLPKDGLNEIAFAGRSNVGKSSLINCLLNRKKMVKISSTPGKTRQLNYFKINEKFYFVDLPGYGFAKVSKSERIQWQKLIEGFIEKSSKLKGVVSIIDGRIGPTKLDLQLLEWLHDLDIQVQVVATKIDKLSKSAANHSLKKYSVTLKPFLSDDIIPFSSVNATGRKELLTKIFNILE